MLVFDSAAAKVGVTVEGRRLFDRDGHLTGELPLAQVLTAWGKLYAILKEALPSDCYHYGRNLTRMSRTTVRIRADQQIALRLRIWRSGVDESVEVTGASISFGIGPRRRMAR